MESRLVAEMIAILVKGGTKKEAIAWISSLFFKF
jgi:hypothetical protein